MPEWERVPLGEVIRHRKEFITIDDLTDYKRCRVQVRAQGIVLRDEVPGSAIKTKKQQVCRAGEFLVAEIDAKMGGFGIVPPELEGAVVSSHYFLFEIDEAKLDRDFLDLYSKTPEFMEQVSAQGSTNYAAIRPSHVLGYTLPLPPLPEQQRIVARVKGMLDKVEEARRLRAEVQQSVAALAWSIHAHADTEAVPVSELVTLRPTDVQVEATASYHFAGVYSFGRGVFVGQTKQGSEFAYPRLTRLQSGNFTYPKLMAWEGAVGVVPPECDGLVVSTEFPVFQINTEKVLPEVLDAYFKNPDVWPQVSGDSTGTNVRRRRLNPSDFLAYPFPLPSRDIQESIAQAWKSAQSLKSAHNTDQELQALPSAILAQAFAGAL